MLLYIVLLSFIAIAACVAWYFIAHDHGEREPIGALWIALGFGFVGAIAAALLEALVVPAHDLTAGTPLWPLLGSTLTIGLIEEACKFVPLSLFLFRKRYFNEHTDGVIYFAIAGLGFGLPENILYTLQFGAKVGVGRIILTPFFHAATTGIVGFFLAKSKISRSSKLTVCGALLLAMILHGLCDFGLSSGKSLFALMSVIITLSLSIGLFLFYTLATDLDQEQGLSVVGHNTFCRACGFPNPKRQLYCTHCGHYA
jgi:RsiW-degrading membrane proteinase PrsW (M82 family)